MLVIRLLRIGKKNQPSFKIVVTDKRNSARTGRFLEIVGFYNSLTKKRDFKVERINYWMSVGAKLSDTVHNLLITEKIIKGEKISSHNKVVKPLEQSSTGKTAEPAVAETPQPAAVVEEPKTITDAPAKEETPAIEPQPTKEEKIEPIAENPAEAPVETPEENK